MIEARNHAEESDRLKSAFLANISHEVRTPLNAIVGFSEVLPMTQSDEEREQLLGLIRDNNAQLLRLFDDMIHMSKLEAGGGTIRKSHFELRPLLEEIVQQILIPHGGVFPIHVLIEYAPEERKADVTISYSGPRFAPAEGENSLSYNMLKRSVDEIRYTFDPDAEIPNISTVLISEDSSVHDP